MHWILVIDTMKYTISSETYEGATLTESDSWSKWPLSFVGSEHPNDERSQKACFLAAELGERCLGFKFDIDANGFFIDDVAQSTGAIRQLLRGIGSILIDATTLTYPEILILLDAANKEKVKEISFLYVEPEEYRRTIGSLSDYRSFSLSENSMYKSVPKFTVNLNAISKGRVVFFLGYEEARLAQAFEQEENLNRWSKSAVFGVPPFSYSMELDAFANNSKFVDEQFQLHFIAASSVSSSYALLKELRTNDKEGNPILVVPIGTKPHAIGAALFVIEHQAGEEAVTIFDHPRRTSGRSLNVRRWHLYRVTDNSI